MAASCAFFDAAGAAFAAGAGAAGAAVSAGAAAVAAGAALAAGAPLGTGALIALTACWHAAERLEACCCRQCSAGAPPVGTLAQ